MPFKRKRSSSRGPMINRAGARRLIAVGNFRAVRRGRNRRMSKGRLGSINVHRYRRWAATDQRLSGTGGTGYADTFSLDKLPSYTEFDTLYDRYKITTVIVKFQLISNPDANYFPGNNTTANADNWYPKLWYYPDYDDNTAPTSLDEVKQNARAKHFVLKPNREFTVKVKPAVNIQTYRTETTTGYSPKWNQWIDIAQVNVPHYGLKYWIDLNGITALSAQQMNVRVERLYYFVCKDVR